MGARAPSALARPAEPRRAVGRHAVVRRRRVPVHRLRRGGVGARLASGPERRKHLLVWVRALLAGTANDMIFMALPLVNNFWQAQATIMLTPRLPLLHPLRLRLSSCTSPTVSVWRTKPPPLSRAALTGLAASLFYAPRHRRREVPLVDLARLRPARSQTGSSARPIGSTHVRSSRSPPPSRGSLGRVVDRDPAVSMPPSRRGSPSCAG